MPHTTLALALIILAAVGLMVLYVYVATHPEKFV